MYQFKYSLNDNDYMEFNKHHLFNAPLGKKVLLILRAMVPVTFILFLSIILTQ